MVRWDDQFAYPTGEIDKGRGKDLKMGPDKAERLDCVSCGGVEQDRESLNPSAGRWLYKKVGRYLYAPGQSTRCWNTGAWWFRSGNIEKVKGSK